MSEQSQFESFKVNKEQVVEAFKPFLEKGVLDPNKLDLSDAEVQKASQLYEQWSEQLSTEVSEGNQEAAHFTLLEIEMFFIEMGFVDPTYLAQVRNDIIGDYEGDPYAEEPEEGTSPEVFKKLKEKLSFIEASFPAPEIKENLSDEEILHLLGDNQERQRERVVKIATFKWFMRHMDEIGKSENPEVAKAEFKEFIRKIWFKIGYFEFLSDLSKVYLEGKKAMGADKKLIKELGSK